MLALTDEYDKKAIYIYSSSSKYLEELCKGDIPFVFGSVDETLASCVGVHF